MRYLFLLVLCLFSINSGIGQASYIGFGNDAYHIYDRLEIKSGIQSPIHSSLKYYSRKDMVHFISLMEKSGVSLSEKDLWDMQYILDDNNEYISTFLKLYLDLEAIKISQVQSLINLVGMIFLTPRHMWDLIFHNISELSLVIIVIL